jgi:TRAP-type mannitol/chloroaromatic compound transport system permease small subunit
MIFFHYIDIISDWSGRIVRWLALILSLVVLYEVIARYVFNRPTIWAFDTAMMLNSGIFLMGGAYVLWEKKHITVDVISRRFPQRIQALIDLIFYLVFLFPYAIVMVWYGGKAAAMSWAAREISNTSQWGELIFYWRAIIPVAFFLLFLQAIPELIRTIVSLRRKTSDA